MTRFVAVWVLWAAAASMAFAQPADRATPGIEESDPASIAPAAPAEPEPPAPAPAAGAALGARLADADLQAASLAVTDMIATFGAGYPNGGETLARLDDYARAMPGIKAGLARGGASAVKAAQELLSFKRRVLLANPLLNFEKLLVIRRKPIGGARRSKGEGYGLGQFLGLPRQSSWQQDTIPDVRHWENDIAVVDPRGPDCEVRTLYRPEGGLLAGDLELSFDARRLLFSMPDEKLRWQVFEADLAGMKPRQVTPSVEANVHNYDACYLPNGRIAFVSTAPLQGVPCNASVNVGMLYVTDADGTSQREYYGSGAYWPNSVFYTRPIPGHPTRVVGIVTGHHVGRVGEMTLFDPAAGQSGNGGVIQRIPGRGKPVKPVILDRLTDDSWPKCLHPYPLAEAGTNRGAGTYFLVAAKPGPGDLWGIYLADVFDNFTLLAEQEGFALLEPIPVLPRPVPPVIADRLDLSRKDAVMYIEDVYEGPGLAGVPRGSVKKLRLFTYHFAYQRLAGISHYVGANFAPFANMSDATMRELAYDTDGRYTADMTPRDSRFNDGKLVTADAGSYLPNAWGLRDMHGNAWEWVRSAYAPYPYADGDGRNADGAAGPRVVRGGSWRDRPSRCRSAYRLSYPSWRKVYNVGFRVIVEDCPAARRPGR